VSYPVWELVAGSAVIIAVSGAFFWGLSHLIATLARRAGVRATTVRAGTDFLRIMWVMVAVAGVVFFTGFTSELTIFLVSGVAGLVVSLALQAVFSNMVAGVLLLQDGTVRLGDVIEYGTVKGRVIRVTLRNTWVRMDSGPVAIIGNSLLSSGPLINHTRSSRFAEEYPV
jgi:small-conductance mechanosensitive channel